MTERKVQRHHVHIGVLLTATGKFTKESLYCPFVPDEVKVKQLAVQGANATGKVYQIQCPTLTGDWKVPLCSYVEPVTAFVGITFPLNKSVNGPLDFAVVDATGEVDPTVDQEYISIHLEFRKYT